MEAHEEDVKLDCIIIGDDRIRPISESGVTALMESMKTIGLINPISITRPRMVPHLVSGAHRLEAAKRLGWTSIRCRVVLTDDDANRLEQIDENLIRNELSPAERAIHIAERKEIYERMHPETRHGAGTGGRSGRTKAEVAKLATSNWSPEDIRGADRFTEDTAKKTGKPERTVRRDATRAKHVPKIKDVIGTSLDKGDELDALAVLPEERQESLIERAKSGEKVSAKTEAKKIKRDEKEAALAEKTEELTSRIGHQLYNVILSDPAWRFEPYSRETGMDRAPENHYATTPLEDIMNLDVPGAAAPDCVLFLWATTPMLPHALDVMKVWGFEYKSHIIWVKDRIGTGYWSRNKHELLLIGTRGAIPAPAMGTQPASAIEAAVTEHSRKPDVFHEIIEQMFPTLPKLEMFARRRRDGWDAWGNEADQQTEEAA